MNINIEDLQKEVDLAERYQKALENIASLQQTIEKFSLENVLQTPADRLIHSGEAAKILGVNQNKISSLVKKGLLTPLFIDSNRRKFWLSEVLALPMKTTKAHKASGVTARRTACR